MRKVNFSRITLTTLLIACSVNFGFKFPEKPSSEDFLNELQGKLEKVDSTLEVVRKRLLSVEEKQSRPDLLMQSAELHLEKSRYLYFQAREKDAEKIKSAKDVPEAIAEKEKAIAAYKRVLVEHPDYFNNDKCIFFMAQELGQVGREEEEVEQYTKLIRNYPKSEFRDDALLILGNKDFDAKKLDTASDYYRQIIDDAGSTLRNVARYKLAWCEVNATRCESALKLFEDVATSEAKDQDPSVRNSLRKDSLVDSVLCYSKVKKPEHAISYYRKLSGSNDTYVAVLDKLANRYYIQEQYKDAIPIYRELIRKSFHLEQRMDYLRRIFGNLRRVGYDGPIDEDSEILVDSLRRYFFSWRYSDEDRKEMIVTLEKYLRDAATRLHLMAQQKKDISISKKAAATYENYLKVFEKTPVGPKMKTNAAEAYFDSKEFLKASKLYTELIESSENDPKTKLDFMHSAIASYFEALKHKENLSKVELIQARSGFLRVSAEYLRIAPNSDRAADIQYTIASIHYDQNEWDPSIQQFFIFIAKYPNHPKVPEAARLLLDSYNMKDDTGGMVEAGKRILSSGRFNNPALLAEVRDIISKAEFKNLEDSLTEKGDISNVASGFFKLSRQYQGTEAGEKALYNAFVSARKANQPSQMIAAAEQLRKDYPKSKLLGELLPMVSQTMLQVGLFANGASVAEQFGSEFPENPMTTDLLLHAGKVRAALGQTAQAGQNFENAAKQSTGPKRAEILEAYAQSMDKVSQWKSLERAASLWRGSDPSSAKAYAYLGRAQFKQGMYTEAQRSAQAGKSRLAQDNSDENKTATSAELSFLEIAPLFERYQNISVPSGNARAEEQAVAVKSQLLEQLEKSYTQVANMGDGAWAIAALAKVAHAYQSFAMFLSKTSVPQGLAAAQAAQYQQVLKGKIQEIMGNANSLYDACQKKAYQLHLYTQDALECAYRKQLPPPSFSQAGGSMDNASFQNLVRMLVKNPKDVSALNQMARIYLGSGRFSSAFLALSRAIEVEPNNAESLNLLGVVSQRMNQDAEAYEFYSKALRSNPSLPQAHANIATLCKKYRDQSCYQQSASRVNASQLSGVPSTDLMR